MNLTPLDLPGLTVLETSRYQWLWGLGVLPVLFMALFWIAALVSIVRSGFSVPEKALFALGTLAFPFLGPLIWFLTVARADKRR